MNVGSALSRWESIQADMHDMPNQHDIPSVNKSNDSHSNTQSSHNNQSINHSESHEHRHSNHQSINQSKKSIHNNTNQHGSLKFLRNPSMGAIIESPVKESQNVDLPPIITTPSLPDLSVSRVADEVFRESDSQSTKSGKGFLHVYDSFPVLAKHDEQPVNQPINQPIDQSINLDAIVFRFARHFAKGCSIGFAAKSGFALIGLLVKYKLNLRLMWLKNMSMHQGSKWSSMLGKSLVGEPLSYGAFLGCVLAIYQTIKRSFPQLSVNVSNHQSIKYSILLSDLIACALISPAINLLPRSHRASIALFVFVRSMECLGRFYAVRYREQAIKPSINQSINQSIQSSVEKLVQQSNSVKRYRVADIIQRYQSGKSSNDQSINQSINQSTSQQSNSTYDYSFRNKLRITIHRLFDVSYRWCCSNSELLVFCLSAAPVCWAALYSTESLDPGYYHFMRTHGGRSDASLSVAANLHHGYNKQQQPFPAAWRALNRERNDSGLQPLQMSDRHLHCKVIHGDEHCLPAFVTFYRAALRRALPVYIPVYVLPLLLFRLPALRKQPISTLWRLCQSIGQSTVFLACYCSVGWTWMCLFRSVHSPYGNQTHAAISGFLSGLTLLLEKPTRRIELCLYVAGHALFACYRALMARRLVPNMPNGLTALFGASLMILLTVHHSRYAQQAIRPTYQSLLKYFFDPPGNQSKDQAKDQSVNQSIKSDQDKPVVKPVNGHAHAHAHARNGHLHK